MKNLATIFLMWLISTASMSHDKVVVVPLIGEDELDTKSLRVLCEGYDETIGENPPPGLIVLPNSSLSVAGYTLAI